MLNCLYNTSIQFRILFKSDLPSANKVENYVIFILRMLNNEEFIAQCCISLKLRECEFIESIFKTFDDAKFFKF